MTVATAVSCKGAHLVFVVPEKHNLVPRVLWLFGQQFVSGDHVNLSSVLGRPAGNLSGAAARILARLRSIQYGRRCMVCVKSFVNLRIF